MGAPSGQIGSGVVDLPLSKSLSELLSAEEVAVIEIGTPTTPHRSLTVEALEARRDNLREKPIDRNRLRRKPATPRKPVLGLFAQPNQARKT